MVDGNYPKSTIVRWKCREGHTWRASQGNVILKGTWCPTCSPKTRRSTRKNNLARAQVLAAKKGGRCLETENFTIKSRVKWECAEGHTWVTPFYVVNRGSWCKKCDNEIKRDSYCADNLRSAHEIAAKNGGACLEEHNFNNKHKVLWCCAKGHQWRARCSNVVMQNHWCPKCIYKTETFCQQVLETLFPTHKFAKTRSLEWLPSGIGGHPLELDMFNNDLCLALEFNGFLHEESVEAFGGKAHFDKICEHDRRKKEACEDEGVCLIVVPTSQVGGGNGKRANRKLITKFIWEKVTDFGYLSGTHLDSLERLNAELDQ